MPMRSFKQVCVLASLFVALTGCSNVVSNTYLHNEALKEKTDQAHESFGAIGDQSDFFASATQLLEQVGQERLDSSARRLNALHELTVATLISDDDGDGSRAVWDRAESVLSDDLAQLSPQAFNAVSNWGELRAALDATRSDIDDSERRVRLFARNYREDGGTQSTACTPSMPTVGSDQPGARFYTRLVRACAVLIEATQELDELTSASGLESTEFHERREDLKRQINDAATARSLLQDRIGAARKAFADESVTFEQEAVASLTERGRRLADVLSSIDDLKYPEEDTSIFGIELMKAGDIVDGKALAQSIRARVLTEELEELIRIMSDPDIDSDTQVQQEARKKYLLIVQSDVALRRIQAFRDMDFPTPQSALMLLEHYRSQSADYDRQIAHLRKQYRLSVTSATAAEKRIGHLMDGLLTISQINQTDACNASGFASYLKRCRSETTRVARILISLDQAHVQGTLPAELAFETSLNNDLVFAVESSKGHAEHVIAILRPAIATLRAYGDGGVKSETIARLMNTLSLIAISVGVN